VEAATQTKVATVEVAQRTVKPTTRQSKLAAFAMRRPKTNGVSASKAPNFLERKTVPAEPLTAKLPTAPDRQAANAVRRLSADDHTTKSWWQRLWSRSAPPTPDTARATPDVAPAKWHPYRTAEPVEPAPPPPQQKSIAELKLAVQHAQSAFDAARDADPSAGPNAQAGGWLIGAAIVIGGVVTGVESGGVLALAASSSILSGYLLGALRSTTNRLETATNALDHAWDELLFAEASEKALTEPQEGVRIASRPADEAKVKTRATQDDEDDYDEAEPESADPRQLRYWDDTDE
jgi:hypothetical protein